MKDIDILYQLNEGLHLEPKELKRAEVLLKELNLELKRRIDNV